MFAHAFGERILAGMTKRRVAEIVRQGDRLNEVLVQLQVACDRARDLCDLQRMRQASAEQVPFVIDEDLRLVFEAPERRGMDDAVTVALELGAAGRTRLGVAAPSRYCRVSGIRS